MSWTVPFLDAWLCNLSALIFLEEAVLYQKHISVFIITDSSDWSCLLTLCHVCSAPLFFYDCLLSSLNFTPISVLLFSPSQKQCCFKYFVSRTFTNTLTSQRNFLLCYQRVYLTWNRYCPLHLTVRTIYWS